MVSVLIYDSLHLTVCIIAEWKRTITATSTTSTTTTTTNTNSNTNIITT